MFQLVSREEYIVFLGQEGRRGEIPSDIVCQSALPSCSHSPPPSTCIFSTSWSFNQSLFQGYFHLDQYFCHLTHMEIFVQLVQYMPHVEIERARIKKKYS